MDFLKIIQSLDELLYEVVSWLLFYPMTLWRVIRSPVRMMMSAEAELGQSERKQFDDVIPPPLFLLLTLALVHVAELGLFGRPQLAVDNPEIGKFVGSDLNLTIFRVLMLSILPLLASIRVVKARGLPLDRPVLKAPFYGQCYAAGLFALLIAAAMVAAGSPFSLGNPAFLAVAAIGLSWLFLVEAHWFSAQIGTTLARGFGLAAILLAQWVLVLVLALQILR